MFSILIVEDELLIAEMLKEMLLELDYQVFGIANDYESTLKFLSSSEKPNLCLVDINLNSEKNGFDIANFINKTYQIPFLFLTSYSDKKTINEAIELKPEAYIIKPFKPTDLYTTIEIVRHKVKLHSNKSQSIIIKDGTVSHRIKLDEIIWLKSDNIYVEIKLNDKKLVVRQSLESLLDELNCNFIIRTHRSYAINLKHLKAIKSNGILIGNKLIPLSRIHKLEVLNKSKNQTTNLSQLPT